ncbi:MAG: right-handed parallel beta-helix repeat-containing protein [Saprospiraceae bacterium]
MNFHIYNTLHRIAETSLLILFVLLLLMSGCFKIDYYTQQDAQLTFSKDTLRFDTVFTSVGSATRSLRIRNPYDQFVRIGRISLENGTQSKFRINVDGVSYPDGLAEDVEIWPKDSIWVFVEVTVDPDDPLSASPFIIDENLQIETNGNQQVIVLEAWGQNANYIPNNQFKGQLAVLSCDLEQINWDDPRPYVIYGALFIDSCTLHLPAGTRVYVHGGIARNDLGIYNDGLIWTLSQGRIVSEGTVDAPVIIQGDRLESEFGDVPGQWGGIRLGPGSKGNAFSHTTIKNSIVGIRADSASTLNLSNVRIYNNANVGLLGIHCSIQATNSLFYNQGAQSVAFTYGGNYQIDYCTIASYGNTADAVYLDNFTCLTDDCSSVRIYRLIASWRNCILTGSGTDELNMVDGTTGKEPFAWEVSFANCVVRVDDLLDQYPNFLSQCHDCIENKDYSDPLFASVDMGQYQLDTLSIAQDKARIIPGISADIDDNPRGELPDIGCFERQE